MSVFATARLVRNRRPVAEKTSASKWRSKVNPRRSSHACSTSAGAARTTPSPDATPSRAALLTSTRGMAGARRSRRLSGDAPPATDEEDEIARLQKERAAAAEAGPSKPAEEKHAGYAREIADEEPDEDEPVRCVSCPRLANPIPAPINRSASTSNRRPREDQDGPRSGQNLSSPLPLSTRPAAIVSEAPSFVTRETHLPITCASPFFASQESASVFIHGAKGDHGRSSCRR